MEKAKLIRALLFKIAFLEQRMSVLEEDYIRRIKDQEAVDKYIRDDLGHAKQDQESSKV